MFITLLFLGLVVSVVACISVCILNQRGPMYLKLLGIIKLRHSDRYRSRSALRGVDILITLEQYCLANNLGDSFETVHKDSWEAVAIQRR